MSSTESEETPATEDEPLLPAGDLDELFGVEEDEIVEPVIPDDLSEDELRARLTKAEKSAAFERNQRIAVARKTWVAEAKEHFPYSAPEGIKADSRRTFLEEAKKQDSDFRERAQPILERAEKTEEEIRAKVQEELEAKAGAAWGKPHTGGGIEGEITEEQTEQRIEAAYKKRDLHEATRALMDGRRI